jgi:hypothetical protein
MHDVGVIKLEKALGKIYSTMVSANTLVSCRRDNRTPRISKPPKLTHRIRPALTPTAKQYQSTIDLRR